jgi:hypothetical protein
MASETCLMACHNLNISLKLLSCMQRGGLAQIEKLVRVSLPCGVSFKINQILPSVQHLQLSVSQTSSCWLARKEVLPVAHNHHCQAATNQGLPQHVVQGHTLQ